MPPPPILKVVEVFPSVQGEGLRQGEPTIFVRLAGCDLRCDFCDTKYAWSGGSDVPVAEVAARVRRIRKRFAADWVCLTGGEPMLQDTSGLAARLKKEGLKVQVETNGLVFRPFIADWLTISPKPDDYAFDRRFGRLAKEAKLVATKKLTLAILKKTRRAFSGAVPVLVQPESDAAWSKAKAAWLVAAAARQGLKNVRLSYQLHKVYKIR